MSDTVIAKDPIPTPGARQNADGTPFVDANGKVDCPRCDARTAINVGTDDEPNWIECPQCGGLGVTDPYLPTDAELESWAQNTRDVGSTLVRSYVNDDGETVHETLADEFRPRRGRPEGWLERAIANGSVRASGAPDPDAGRDYSKARVVEVPLSRTEWVARHIGEG